MTPETSALQLRRSVLSAPMPRETAAWSAAYFAPPSWSAAYFAQVCSREEGTSRRAEAEWTGCRDGFTLPVPMARMELPVPHRQHKEKARAVGVASKEKFPATGIGLRRRVSCGICISDCQSNQCTLASKQESCEILLLSNTSLISSSKSRNMQRHTLY